MCDEVIQCKSCGALLRDLHGNSALRLVCEAQVCQDAVIYYHLVSCTFLQLRSSLASCVLNDGNLSVCCDSRQY